MPKEKIAPRPQVQTEQKKEDPWQTVRQVIGKLKERDGGIMLTKYFFAFDGATLEIQAMAKEKDDPQSRLFIDLRELLIAHGFPRWYINSLKAMFVPDNPTDSFISIETKSPAKTSFKSNRFPVISRFRYSCQEGQKAQRQSEDERSLPVLISRLDNQSRQIFERIRSQTEVPNSIDFPATAGKICKIVVEEIINKTKVSRLAPETIEALKNALFQQPAQ